MITTPRLRLLPATAAIARAEIDDRERFGRLLDAAVPDNWPPETLGDALAFFLRLLEENPSWSGWLGWYAVTTGASEPATLIGSVGYKGPADANGDVEIGYSVLPQYQGLGYATEMAGALAERARRAAGVRRVLAQTADDNASSKRVLEKLGFEAVGSGTDPGSTLYAAPLGTGRHAE